MTASPTPTTLRHGTAAKTAVVTVGVSLLGGTTALFAADSQRTIDVLIVIIIGVALAATACFVRGPARIFPILGFAATFAWFSANLT